MIVALKFCFVILSCAVFVQGDVSHFNYNRHRGQRVQTLRLQRLETEPTPYPAAGYRPNREFNLPSGQPLFPLANQHSDRPHASSGFDNLSEPQRPQLTYGSPDQEPRFRPQNRPQNFNGFNNLAEPQQNDFVVQYESSERNQGPQQSHSSASGFNNFEEPQQPQTSNSGNFNNFVGPQQSGFVEQTQFSSGNQQSERPQNNNNDFSNLAEPQQPQERPEILYGAPSSQEQEAQSARLRQRLVARLQQAQRLEQLQQQAEIQRYRQSQSQTQSQQQQFFNSPQTLYSAPNQRQQTQAQAESRTSRLIARKPARLTDNREETELENDAKTSETVEEIETTTKAERKNTVNQTVNTPVVANTGVVGYYPAGAFSFVQPFTNAAYVGSPNYQTVQPLSAAYTVSSPFLPQQYALAATAPAQLQAW